MAQVQFQPAQPGVTASDLFSSGVEQSQSMMARASNLRQQRQMEQLRQQQIAEGLIMLPLKQAQAKADMVKAGTDYQIALRTQESRDGAYKLYDSAMTDFNFINQVPNDEVRARLSREWLSRYSQLSNIKELEPQVKQLSDLSLSNINASLALSRLMPAGVREFNALTANMTPEEKQKAAKVRTGLEGRKSGAAIQYKQVIGPDGQPQLVAVDPRAVGAQVVDSGETFGSGVSETPESRRRAAGEMPQSRSLTGQTASEEAQSKESGKLKAEREAALPRRKAAVAKISTATDRLIDDIDSLIPQVNALTAGPGGTILGTFPGTSARDLQANLDSIAANVGFEALQAMRDASKTGGALGNVTERELDLLQATLASLKVGQSPSQLIANLKKARNRIAENAGAAQRALDMEYGDQAAGDSGEKTVGKYKVKVIQ